jgi:hypothetical protein
MGLVDWVASPSSSLRVGHTRTPAWAWEPAFAVPGEKCLWSAAIPGGAAIPCDASVALHSTATGRWTRVAIPSQRLGFGPPPYAYVTAVWTDRSLVVVAANGDVAELSPRTR